MQWIVGNWKMNGSRSALAEAEAVAAAKVAGVRVGICPPATLIAPMAAALDGTGVFVGAQVCHHNASGAHTGDLSAAMLAEAGAVLTLAGHSERRADHGETDAAVKAQAAAALAQGLDVIVCVGETLEERKAGQALAIVTGQVRESLPDGADAARVAIAYEPVWAIGTGLTPTLEEIDEVHGAIRKVLAGMEMAGANILYGGSVKPDNAADILARPDVGGALVGGASLTAEVFLPIVRAARRA